MKTEAKALQALKRLHTEAERAATACNEAPELAEPLRDGLLQEIDALAIRVVELAGLAHSAAELHQRAGDLAVLRQKGGRRG
jgi:hypothetical protein